MFRLLDGLRIVEASSFVAGPTAGLYFAQLGAEVTRIDQAGGGPDYRRWPRAQNGESFYWENLNRGKKSIALDLGRTEGRMLCQRLAASTGLFITNFPADGFLAHKELQKLRPDLITVRVMGHADGRTALDYTVNAAIGAPYLTGSDELGDGPINAITPAWDFLTGAYVAFALLAALRRREQTGEGGEIRVALADVAIGAMANLGMLAECKASGKDRERVGNKIFGAFGRDFRTRDGERLMILAITQKQWRGLLSVLHLTEAVRAIEAELGVSFETDEATRYLHQDRLLPLVEAEVAQRESAELSAALEAAGCCFGPYRRMVDTMQDAGWVTENPMFQLTRNQTDLAYHAAGSFAHTPDAARPELKAGHSLGDHTTDMLKALLDMGQREIDDLLTAGVVQTNRA